MKRTILLLILFIPIILIKQNIQAQSPAFATLLANEERKLKGLKIGIQTPNELKDYSFFRKGKLKPLKLGISTKKDIQNIFEVNCIEFCVYDAKWQIQFIYFDNKIADTKQLYDEKGNKSNVVNYIALPEYVGKLRSVRLIPKSKISFNQIIFPNEFEKPYGLEFGYDVSGNVKGFGVNQFKDRYGLSYKVFAGDFYETLKDAVFYNLFKEKIKQNMQKGDLFWIEYEIPRGLEKKLFVEYK